MKKAFLIAAIVIVAQINVEAQKEELHLKDLQTPNSPGFVLADKSPSSVEKPTNPRTFGISLFNLREGGAVEATPFWFFQQPNYTQKKFVKPAPVLSTFNISAATFKTDSTSVLSVGFKTHLLRIFSKSTKAKLEDLDTTGANIAGVSVTDSIGVSQLDEVKLRWLGGASFKTLSSSAKEKAVLKAIDSLKKEINNTRAKPVFQTELAAAYLGESDNNSFKHLSATRAGVWLNFHFKPQKFPLDILLLSKYSWAIGSATKTTKDNSFLDVGLGLSFEKEKFDFHLEYVNRQDFSIDKNFDRLVFVTNFQLFDEIVLVASFGKNFTEVDNLFTVFGTRIGISNGKVKLGK